MQAHAEGYRQQSSLAESEHEDEKQDRGRMKRSRGRVLRGIRLIEEMHRRLGAKAPLPQAEPDIVVGVDEHAASPETQCAAADKRGRQHRTRGGDQDVIPNSHCATPFSVLSRPFSVLSRDAAAGGRYPRRRYHSTVRVTPVARSVAAVKPSRRAALMTS